MQARVNGSDRHTNQLGDVLAAMVLDLEHDHDHSVIGIQGVEQSIQSGVSLLFLRAFIGRGHLCVPVLAAGWRYACVSAVNPFSTPEGPTAVRCHAAQADSVEPSRELGFGIVSVKASMCDHEHILKNVFEVGPRDTHPLQSEPDEVLLTGIDADEIEFACRWGRSLDRGSGRPVQR